MEIRIFTVMHIRILSQHLSIFSKKIGPNVAYRESKGGGEAREEDPEKEGCGRAQKTNERLLLVPEEPQVRAQRRVTNSGAQGHDQGKYFYKF